MLKLHEWHRYIGIVSAFFVIILSATGVVLNYNDTLELDNNHISNQWLLDHYNIGEFPITSYQSNKLLISHSSQYIFIDGKYVLQSDEALLGAIHTEEYIILATPISLILLDYAGNIIDEISQLTGLPEAPLGISKDQSGHPVVRGVNTYWKASPELTAWQPLRGPHPQWVAPTETPLHIAKQIQDYVRSHEITLERMLLDLHSGRLMGDFGKNIMSIAALLFIILAISGIIIWFRKSSVR